MRLVVVLTAISSALLECAGDSPSTAPTEESTASTEEPIEVVEQPTSTAAPTSLDGRAEPPSDCSDYENDFIIRDSFDRVVKVPLICEHDGDLPLVERVVSSETDQLTAIVEQLFLGTTADEAAAGLQSSFSPYTAGQFDAACAQVTTGWSSSTSAPVSSQRTTSRPRSCPGRYSTRSQRPRLRCLR